MRINPLLQTSAVLGLLVGLNACAARECTDEERHEVDADDDAKCTKIEGFKTFTDETKEVKTEAWEAGDDLLINGHVKKIDVVEGSGDEVKVSYQAQVDLAQSRSDEDVLATMENLTNSLEKSGSTIRVSADRGDSESNLGALVRVELPSGFDGNITIKKGSSLVGDVDLDFVGAAKEVELDLDSLGDVRIQTALGLEVTKINCNGDILTGSFDAENFVSAVLHTEIGDIETSFAKPPSHSAIIQADFGDIDITLPDEGDYTMQVTAEDGVSVSGLPGACELNNEDEQAQSLTCNAGDADRVTFTIESDGEAVIGFR
jgi:hypothetical protein